ncbi:hypothetical protein Ahy_A06g028743 [Arachis hypogaea]|uniref:Uncharacterized protein n=1 Tax=Arachis hypogaea TaxID=3818 RepID=A0A445CRQ2_ARAHY|nr:hypothetical protein Ahy_A06g028743 [Arachis hypogaea]
MFQECEGIGNNSKAAEKNPQSGNEAMFQAEKNSKNGNKKIVEDDTMDQDDGSSNEEGEDTSGLSIESNKKGMSIDMYLKVHGINFEDEEDEEDEEDTANIEGNGGQASNEGTKKKTRGKILCKKLHATDFNDRREVEFLQGQHIGPTKEVVANLGQFLGSTVRNLRFVTLWTQKFILPISSKSWVMRGFCRAWKKYKGEIKKEHFLKYNTKKEMIKNRPLEIPEFQFCKLIRYWSLPAIKCSINQGKGIWILVTDGLLTIQLNQLHDDDDALGCDKNNGAHNG